MKRENLRLLELLMNAGFTKFYVDTEIWQETLDEEEKLNYGSTPMFMVEVTK